MGLNQVQNILEALDIKGCKRISLKTRTWFLVSSVASAVGGRERVGLLAILIGIFIKMSKGCIMPLCIEPVPQSPPRHTTERGQADRQTVGIRGRRLPDTHNTTRHKGSNY